MNYPFALAAMGFFGAKTRREEYNHDHFPQASLDAGAFAERIEEIHGWYDWEINHAQFNLLDSHDTARSLWVMGDDKSALRLAVLFQMTMPGAPCIYYGDEIGMTSDGSPTNRSVFPWRSEGTWDLELREHYRRAIALRRGYAALRTGSFEAIHAANGVYAFRRRLHGQEAVVAFNVAVKAQSLLVDAGSLSAASYTQVWPADAGTIVCVVSGQLRTRLPARNAVVLLSDPSSRHRRRGAPSA